MDIKGKLQYLVPIALVAGLFVGAGSLMLGSQDGGSPQTGASATLTLCEDAAVSHHSTEIRGVYVVNSGDVTAAMDDNLEDDPAGLVVAEFTTDGGTADVDWGTSYQLIVRVYGQENEVSNDVANMQVGIDGDYWGNGDGSVTLGETDSDGDNCVSRTKVAGPFDVGGDDHISANFEGNSGGFTLDRDETADISEILLQAYF